MIKTFKYRLVPTRKQGAALQQTLDLCRNLYNCALEQRRMQHVGQFAQIENLRKCEPSLRNIETCMSTFYRIRSRNSIEHLMDSSAAARLDRSQDFHDSRAETDLILSHSTIPDSSWRVVIFRFPRLVPSSCGSVAQSRKVRSSSRSP